MISLDDGWENQFEYGFPILYKYRDTATFYVLTDYLDHENFMTTDQLKTLVAAGMTTGGHTHSHPCLTFLGQQRAWDEIDGGKVILDADGFNIDTLAYPYGVYNARGVDMVREAGFRTGPTVDAGTRATVSNFEKLPGIMFQIHQFLHQPDNANIRGGAALRIASNYGRTDRDDARNMVF